VGLTAGERTLPALLERQAARHPDVVLIRAFGTERTFEQQRDLAARWAGRLADAGIVRGDRIAIMSENRLEVLDLWLGAAWLGAVAVPVNTAARGLQLAHVLQDSGAVLLVLAEELLPVLDGLGDPPPQLTSVWVLDRESSGSWGAARMEPHPAPSEPLPPADCGPGDTAAILYTSGTTGPSKGVLCPHGQWYWWGHHTSRLLGVRSGDVLYSCLPLFHTNALNTFAQALVTGATFSPGPRFSASAFWQRLTEAEATVTYLLGAMVHILAKRSPDPFEHAHRTRIALAPATPAHLYKIFYERFGVELVDGWGSTETNFVISTAGVSAPRGSMGAVVDGFEARAVDEQGEQVPDASPGELVVRASERHSFSSGYHGLPEQTAEAWRNGWFHTGDRVVRDADGWFWFLDRLKDSIRRRGENISSYEVEAALTTHEAVAAAAVVPVPADVGEDEVMAFIVLREGSELLPEQLIRFLEPRLAYFAIPRYLEFVRELPLTANGKVEKYRLRERGLSAETWDRERAGVTLRR
jgi:crotonobetaine/carnitine-CoA ligase